MSIFEPFASDPATARRVNYERDKQGRGWRVIRVGAVEAREQLRDWEMNQITWLP